MHAAPAADSPARTTLRGRICWVDQDVERERASEVTIYSSWRGMATAFASPLLLLAVGAIGVSAVGFRGVPRFITIIGLGLLTVSLLDLPLHTRFDAEGIHRRCLLRQHTLPWDRVTVLQRARGNLKSYVQLKGTADERMPSGGLVAVVGRARRYQLSDRIECRSEFDMLRDVVRLLDGDVELTAVRPSAASPPTTLYRRGVPNPPPPVDVV